MSGSSCLIYCPLPYNGRGPSKTCMGITEYLSPEFSHARLFLPKSRSAPPEVPIVTGIPSFLSRLPWKFVKNPATARMNSLFKQSMEGADASSTVAYFWPSPTDSLLQKTKQHGIISVREMINCYRGTAKRILDQAFRNLDIAPYHGISQESVDQERLELSRYDYVLASNDQCELSLAEAGVHRSRILKTSFGWSLKRFDQWKNVPKENVFTVTFVGSIGVRKGVHCLLEAWRLAGRKGRLVLVGNIEPQFQPILSRYANDPSVRVIAFTNDIEKHYKSSHVFAFPTLEEGGPQVTYEAAGCGLPVIATLMGAGRLVKHETNGLIVPAGDAQRLAEAIVRLRENPSERTELGERAARHALQFTYEKIGRQRAELFRQALDQKV